MYSGVGIIETTKPNTIFRGEAPETIQQLYSGDAVMHQYNNYIQVQT